MGRVYSAPINITAAFTAVIDIFELLAGTNKPLVIHGWEIGQTSELGDAQEEVLILILNRVTGAPTSGSGGGTSTPAAVEPGDGASGVTLETGNTTVLTGGTSTEVARFPWQVRAPHIYQPIPEEKLILDQATRFVLKLGAAPADSISAVVGRLVFEELV